MDSILSGNLSLITFFPLLGIPILIAVGYFSSNSKKAVNITALSIFLIEFFISIPLFVNFDPSTTDPQFVSHYTWINSLGMTYFLGLDGLSVLLVLLTTFMMPITALSAWNAIEKGRTTFLVLMLLLETALIGTFAALDIALFFVFWEAVLIPMYFMIGIWGTERRIYAAVKFFIYTAFGSALMLVAIFYLYSAHVEQFGYASMNIYDLYRVQLPFAGLFSPQGLCFAAFFLAFAIKVPLFPFHTWLPDAHVEAPTAASVILAAVLLKMGTYALIRFLLPLFPEATVAFLPWVCALAIIGIIYGAMVAFAQADLKKLVAYSSVSHMGLIMLGIFVLNLQGIQGSIFHMLSHGLSTGALFLIVGMIYERRHTKMIKEFGGISKVMPLFAVFFLITTLASIGLPLLNGFVGEFLILLGVFQFNYVYSALGASGIVLGAIYMLWAYQKVMFGPLDKEENKALLDLSAREVCVLLPIVIMIFVMGIYPKPILKMIEPSVTRLVETNYSPNYSGSNYFRGVSYTKDNSSIPPAKPDLFKKTEK